MLLSSPALKYYVLAAGLGTLSRTADGNSNILMQMSKPNNPVFSKGSSAQNPRLMFPAVTLMWKKWPTVSEIIMPTSSLRLHTGTRSLQTGVLHILFLPLNPCIKPACVLTLEELVWAPICLSPPAPHLFPQLSERPTSGSCWVTSGVDRFSSQHVKSVSISLSLTPCNTLWFCPTWLVDNKEQVAVKGLMSSCLFSIHFVSFVRLL